jgi:DNA-binding beta-propeller fold protein YncE
MPYARNADHLPRPDQILLHDGLLYVTLQDVNRSFTEFLNGRVAIIDPASRTVTGVIDLHGQNPFESLEYSSETGRIYVGLAGIFPGLKAQSLTGGVEAIDPASGLSTGLVVDDDDLGGNVSGMAIVSATRGYAVVTDLSFRNYLKGFDPETGVVTGTVLETTDRLSAIVADDGWLLVAVGSFVDPRLLVLDGATLRLLASLSLRLPPQSVTVMKSTL